MTNYKDIDLDGTYIIKYRATSNKGTIIKSMTRTTDSNLDVQFSNDGTLTLSLPLFREKLKDLPNMEVDTVEYLVYNDLKLVYDKIILKHKLSNFVEG